MDPLICLTVKRRDDAGAAVGRAFCYRFDQAELLIGRSESVEIRLPDPAISLVHARISRSKGRWLIVDAGSTNGTTLDGQPLVAEAPRLLEVGSQVVAGPFLLERVDADHAPLWAPTDAESTASLARQMVLEAINALGADPPRLLVERGPNRGERLLIRLDGRRLLVGRGDDCDLRLTDADASRRHFAIAHEDDGVLLHDLGSKNGVHVNGVPVGEPRQLIDGDRIVLGQTELRYQDPASAYLAALDSADPEVAPLGSTGAAAGDRSGRADGPGGAGEGLAVSALAFTGSTTADAPQSQSRLAADARISRRGQSSASLSVRPSPAECAVRDPRAMGRDRLTWIVALMVVAGVAAAIVYLLL